MKQKQAEMYLWLSLGANSSYVSIIGLKEVPYQVGLAVFVLMLISIWRVMELMTAVTRKTSYRDGILSFCRTYFRADLGWAHCAVTCVLLTMSAVIAGASVWPMSPTDIGMAQGVRMGGFVLGGLTMWRLRNGARYVVGVVWALSDFAAYLAIPSGLPNNPIVAFLAGTVWGAAAMLAQALIDEKVLAKSADR